MISRWILLLSVTLLATSSCATDPIPAPTARSSGVESGTSTNVSLDDGDPLRESDFAVIAETRWPERDQIGRWIRDFDASGVLVIGETGHDIESPREDRHWLSIGGREVPLRTPAHEGKQQWVASEISDRWVVWKATTSFDLLAEPWVMYAFDRRAGTVRELGRSAMVDGADPPPVPGYTGPVIIGERVFWAQVDEYRGQKQSNVYGCEIESCEPRLLLRNAAFPTGDEAGVAVIHLPDILTGRTPTTMSIVRFDPKTWRRIDSFEVPLVGKMPSGFAMRGAVGAWTTRNDSEAEVVIRNFDDGRTWTLDDGGKPIDFSAPRVGDGFVVWPESSGSGTTKVGGYLFDLPTGRLLTIGNASAHQIEAKGSLVSWMEKVGPPDNRVVVDRVVTFHR